MNCNINRMVKQSGRKQSYFMSEAHPKKDSEADFLKVIQTKKKLLADKLRAVLKRTFRFKKPRRNQSILKSVRVISHALLKYYLIILLR